MIQSEQDFDVLVKYGQAMLTTPTWPSLSGQGQEMYTMAENWFGIVLVWSSPRVYSGPNGPMNCQDRCRIDPECKAYIVSPYQVELSMEPASTAMTTTTSSAAPTPPASYNCMLFSETWPYSVYTYNVNASMQRYQWSSPISPVM